MLDQLVQITIATLLAPVVGLSLLTMVRIANGMGLSSIFGTKSSTKIAESN